jgi:hypothetical protein
MLVAFLKRLFASARGKGGERRRESREGIAFGAIRIDGMSCPLKNWSTSGFLAGGYTGNHKHGDHVGIALSVQLPGRSFEMTCKGIVVRADPQAREIAGVFTLVGPDDRVALERHFEPMSS